MNQRKAGTEKMISFSPGKMFSDHLMTVTM